MRVDGKEGGDWAITISVEGKINNLWNAVQEPAGAQITFRGMSYNASAAQLVAMLITAFAIGSASIVFQSIINNTIVTPCLLGMDQLYSLIHTAVFFATGS